MAKFVFSIGTEHHLFQVKAAIKHFNINANEILLLVFEIGNTNYIDGLKRSNNFGSIHVFPNWTFKDLFFNRSKFNSFITFCKELKKDISECTFFSSHYDSDPDLLLLAIVKPHKYYLMDEGTASFTVQNNRLKHDGKPVIINFIKSILYGHFIKLPKKLTYFTQYNLQLSKNEKIEKYEIEKRDNPLLNLNINEALFIGTSIVEVGYLKEMDYLSMMLTIYNDIKSQKVYYYPHRKESAPKLLQIASIGFNIKKIDEPFESFFSKQIETPAFFCSLFVTGVLDNISKANETIPKLRIYKFDTNIMLEGRVVYDNIYREMSSNKDLVFYEL